MSLISDDSINAIREKADLVEIVSNYVTLKKTGRTHKGLCPFHGEKTPSFAVDSQKQLFHCFGCQEGGNVFNFMMKVENVDFADAVEILAKQTGSVVNYVSKGKNERSKNQKEIFYQINKEAADFYHQQLIEGEKGKVGREYLKSRNYGKNVAKKFKIGYAPPNRSSLIDLLVKKGHKQQDIAKADLAYVSGGSQARDRFINRLMFPIQDVRGNIIGFGGRALAKDEKAKYINSSQTPVFEKGRQFYNLDKAKNEIVKKDRAIIVEGYTDVISLHKNGFQNVVATLGTALTDKHVEIMSRFCASAVMLFDSDEAGLKAAQRTVEFANLTKLELMVAVLPDGDPADFVSGKGAEALQKLLDAAVPVVDFCLERIVASSDISTAQKRLAAISKAFDLIKSQHNVILEQEYLHRLANLTGVSVQDIATEYRKKQGTKQQSAVQEQRTLTVDEKAEILLLTILLERTDLINRCSEVIEPGDFLSELNKEIFKVLAEKREQEDIADLIAKIENAQLKNKFSELSLLEKPQYIDQAFADALKKVKDCALRRKINQMKAVLEKTNPVDSRVEYDKLFKRLIDLEAKRRDLKQVIGVN
ncbi:hypothetical protein LCGC14_1069190 [marine sediment metagenome]|uniref:Toprim domain-containing protein n=1 Tax=marine sediment metagenome TaxID=412755 RepID=A0A0F9QPK1_9ZZZZ